MQYEDSRRYTKEGATIEEFEIANNGPNIANIVKEAIDLFWSRKRYAAQLKN